jgi:hypothetical protein
MLSSSTLLAVPALEKLHATFMIVLRHLDADLTVLGDAGALREKIA